MADVECYPYRWYCSQTYVATLQGNVSVSTDAAITANTKVLLGLHALPKCTEQKLLEKGPRHAVDFGLVPLQQATIA